LGCVTWLLWIFNFLSDSFVLPVNGKNPDARCLADRCRLEGRSGSLQSLKGSICARTDCDQTLFSEYSQDAGKDWTSNTVVGSLWHGVVAAPAWVNSIGTAVGLSRLALWMPLLRQTSKMPGHCLQDRWSL